MCTHTPTLTRPWLKHTQTGGRGWLALSHSPALCWFWALFRAFQLLVFRLLLLGAKVLSANWDFLHACKKTSQSASSYNELWMCCYLPGLVREEQRLRSSSHLLRSRSVKQPQRWTARSSGRPYCPKTTSCSPKSERHMVTVTQGTHTSPRRIMGLWEAKTLWYM